MPKARPTFPRPTRSPRASLRVALRASLRRSAGPLKKAACGVWLLPLLATGARTARADLYHAVSSGDTLQSVANKYHVSSEQLRAANNLKENDNSPLGAMLLRVPTAETAGGKSVSLSSNFGQSTFSPVGGGFRAPSGSGVLSKSVNETVRASDTWETIAARYRAMGNDVSTDSLRRRNGWTDLPAPGETVIVPLGQVAYSAPRPVVRQTPATSIAASAQTAPRVISPGTKAPRALDGGVTASGEVDWPVVKDNSPTQPPVFGASAPSAAPRRGSSLPSRGGYGQMARSAAGGQVRVLGGNEEADAPPPSSQARIASAPRSVNTLATVAKVSLRGASIRRLPQASAVTLYKCALGTQLAVLKRQGMWSAVLMSDRSTGWVPTKYLAFTPQTIDVSAQFATNDPGGSVTRYNGSYAGENPMVANALTWLGTRYVYGGTSRRGIDCSSLVQHAFASCGYRLPRTAAQQSTVGVDVKPDDLRAGDRLYFSASGTRIDHTGLYMGNGLFVHASGSGRQVMVSNLFTKRNWNIFICARR